MSIRVNVAYADGFNEVLTFEAVWRPTLADVIRHVGFVALAREDTRSILIDVDMPLRDMRLIALEWTHSLMSRHCSVAERYLKIMMDDLSKIAP